MICSHEHSIEIHASASQPPPSDQPPSPARRKFIQRITSLPIKPAARDYYVRWAESWTKARGHQSAERTQEYFDALGRSAHLADWQFRQAVDAARILACDVLTIPWAPPSIGNHLSDQARSLEPDHRTLARETIRVGGSICHLRPQPSPEQLPPGPKSELTHLIDSLRRAIRLKDSAVATEETYVYWNPRFIRFCHLKLGQSPQAAGPPAITAYLDFLALERNVAPATQKQALNAMAFLMKNVFGIEEFTLDHITPGLWPAPPARRHDPRGSPLRLRPS